MFCRAFAFRCGAGRRQSGDAFGAFSFPGLTPGAIFLRAFGAFQVNAVYGDNLASHTHPSLTSVRVFPERAGEAAVRLLDGMLRGVEVDVPVLVDAQLVRRESTRRPR